MVSTTIKVRIPGPKSIYVGVIRYITDTLPDPPCSAQQDVLQYISIFYNSHRPHSYLGYKSQNQYEAEMEKLKNVTQLEYPVLLDQIIAKCPGVLGQNKEQ